MPEPPHASGTAMPRKPSSAIRFTSSAGWRCSRSISAALGSTSSRAKSRAVFWTRVCSSVRANCMIRRLPLATLERGVALGLAQEGVHAFLLIVGREQEPEAALLHGQGVIERHRLAEVDQPLA